MRPAATAPASWPLHPVEWADSQATFHLWTQVVGKIRLALTPLISHWWNVPLYVTARGLTSSLMPHPSGRGLQIDFDLIDHRLVILATDGTSRSRPLTAEPVAEFYRAVTGLLDQLGLGTPIWTMPVEIPDAIPFEQDEQHASYDRQQIHQFWRVLVESQRVFEVFRSEFLGKTSPVHLFWGGLDLAETRFSGRAAPRYPHPVPNCGPHVMLEAYSREVSSCGYWPSPSGRGAYYSYAYPEPEGFRDASVLPAEASYDAELGEFVLPYDVVQAAADPDAVLLQFLRTTYEAAADLAGWDRQLLERPRHTSLPRR
jgi:hypothetical protein